jgi:hypothetical protein
MPAHNANLRAEGMLAQWNFPNNYTLSKHLAEYMVADYQKQFNMPVAIVRPTLISSVARDPYPGARQGCAGTVLEPAVGHGWVFLLLHQPVCCWKQGVCCSCAPRSVTRHLGTSQHAPGVAAAAAAVMASVGLMPGAHQPSAHSQC